MRTEYFYYHKSESKALNNIHELSDLLHKKYKFDYLVFYGIESTHNEYDVFLHIMNRQNEGLFQKIKYLFTKNKQNETYVGKLVVKNY